jgi:hypothetical protein
MGNNLDLVEEVPRPLFFLTGAAASLDREPMRALFVMCFFGAHLASVLFFDGEGRSEEMDRRKGELKLDMI